ncbi:Pr6Pr family membrane protein [Rathayibacter sp. ZW T2_19]|uniref:Pr6Pr family membrane protein n=1 Tax=Rathayibacter rubneri TaxID=2950106 RepID=A0A9X2IRX2_9MICO|nr:Pr6Pr family membrane protein [Rathayibacter rubneri]MCM6761337.1 Pr6Pr family membrane protein [Rathayibacter rubneri]
MRSTFVLVRLLVAVAILAATVVSFLDSYSFWVEARFRDRTTLVVNFFSYITVETCLAAAVVLLIGAVLLARGRLPDPRWFSWLRAGVVACMVVIGVVYNLLLRGTAVTGAGAPQEWTNEVMHVVAPLALVLDWLFAPGRRRLSWGVIPGVLAVPVAWFAYTMLRAPLVYDQMKHEQVWYPYPFLDPRLADPPILPGGGVAVVFYVVALSSLFAASAWFTVWISRRPSRRRGIEAGTAEEDPVRGRIGGSAKTGNPGP